MGEGCEGFTNVSVIDKDQNIICKVTHLKEVILECDKAWDKSNIFALESK